jgi:hypothetical protein
MTTAAACIGAPFQRAVSACLPVHAAQLPASDKARAGMCVANHDPAVHGCRKRDPRMRNVLFVVRVVCVASACASATAGCQRTEEEQVQSTTQALTGAEIAANHLTAFLGVPVQPSDIKTYPGSREFVWGYTPALETMLRTNEGTLLFATHHTSGLPFVSFAVRPTLRSELSSSQHQQCTINLCDPNGHCSGITGLFEKSECNKPQICTTDADCGIVTTCYVRTCGLGHCVAEQVQSPGSTCPPDVCGSDTDCSSSSSKKTCSYKKCQHSLCMSVTVEVDKDDPCPTDQCSADADCGGGSDIPIFQDVND